MTIVTEVTHASAGFTLRLATQIGCATTDDYPSAETERSASEDLRRRLGPLAARVERAFAHFVSGTHPMTLVRRHLGTGGFADQAWWRDASIQLHLKADAPDIVRQKAPVDFLLSLAFAEEFRDAPFAFPVKPEEALFQPAASAYGVASLVGLACTRPDWLLAVATAPLPGQANQRDYDDGFRRFRVKILQRVLDRQPYAQLLAEARRLDRLESIRWLMYIASEVQAPELPSIMEIADPAVRGYYAGLL